MNGAALLSFLTFFAFALPPAFLVRGLLKRVAARHFILHLGSHRTLPFFIPSLALGLGLFLLIFSLSARVVESYWISVPLSYFALYLLVRLLHRIDGYGQDEKVEWSSRLELPSVLLFLGLHLGLLFLRSHFANIHFDPSRFGAEKMYNYAFQQAFLFGSGFPPENLWLAGDPNVYYLMPKAIAGLSSFFLRELGHVFVGGYLFHISDTFYYTLGIMSLMTTVFFVFQLRSKCDKKFFNKSVALAVGVGLIPLLAAPARALWQVFEGRIELWSLSRIIENTVNEYPFWNFLWADNHAHSAVMFLQISLWFWLIILLVFAKKQFFSLCFFVAALASAVLLSHSGSVLINLVSMGTFACGIFLGTLKSKLERKEFLKKILIVGFTTMFLSFVDLLNRSQAEVKWYFVPPKFTSTLAEFFNINFVIATLVPTALILGLLSLPKSTQVSFRSQLFFGLSCCFFAAFSLLGYPVVGYAILVSAFAVCLLRFFQDNHFVGSASALCAASMFWIFPEVLAANFNMGDEYMRYNTLFRFLYESFYIVPLLWAFALAVLIDFSLPRKFLSGFVSVVLLSIAVLFAITQWKTYEHRLTRDPQPTRLDGTAYFQKERPFDYAIVKFLQDLPGRVVVAEECGIHPKPAAYTVAGRIATLSGRPALCGWAHHTSNFQKTILRGGFQGQPAYSNLIQRDKWISTHFQQLSETMPSEVDFIEAKENFKKLGVTHLIFGEYEKLQHPNAQLAHSDRIGKLVFRSGDFGVVELSQ